MKLKVLSLSGLIVLILSGFTPLHTINYVHAQNPTIGGVSYTDCGTLNGADTNGTGSQADIQATSCMNAALSACTPAMITITQISNPNSTFSTQSVTMRSVGLINGVCNVVGQLSYTYNNSPQTAAEICVAPQSALTTNGLTANGFASASQSTPTMINEGNLLVAILNDYPTLSQESTPTGSTYVPATPGLLSSFLSTGWSCQPTTWIPVDATTTSTTPVTTVPITTTPTVVPTTPAITIPQAGTDPEGTTVINNGTVYIISNEQLRPYTSAGAFLSYNFNSWSNVVQATTADLTLPIGSYVPPKDGTVFCSDRGVDKGTCYLISQSVKVGFPSEAIFTGQGFSFTNAIYGDASFLPYSTNITSSTQAHLPGTVINENGVLYVVTPTVVMGFSSATAFNSWGYSFTDVVPANTADKMLTIGGTVPIRAAGQISLIASVQ